MGSVWLAHQILLGVTPFMGWKPILVDLSLSPTKGRADVVLGGLLPGESGAAQRLRFNASHFTASKSASSSDLRYAVSLSEPNKSRIQLTLTFMVFCT